MFSTKFSLGHNERKFGHTANFLAKIPKNFCSKSRKVGRKLFFFEEISFFLQGDPLGPIECGLKKSPELFFPKVQIRQNWSKNIWENFHKMFLWMCNMQFRERSQKKFAKVRRFFDQSLRRTKKFPLLKALFSSKNRFWVHRLQNWQACQDYHANSPKIAAPRPKEMERGNFNWKRLFFTRRTSGMIESSFDKRPFFS